MPTKEALEPAIASASGRQSENNRGIYYRGILRPNYHSNFIWMALQLWLVT